MPPSPAMRCSPGRESLAGNHIRGRSLEGPIPYRDKDDDLELFNEVQTKERDNFLLQSNDDFEDLFSSKLKYFSNHQLGIPKPSAGESSDMLNAEGEKNDYDWLLTPPDTPLFTSLDDETHPVCLPLRGRPRSQPISISRSSTMEKSHRSSRGSASPNRTSLSPGSSHARSRSRGRPSSLPGTSPPPSLRNNTTPTRRPSPPPLSKPNQRSSTPSPKRMSTGGSSSKSPANKSGGRISSSSPKIKAWQANIPGFSSEVPPNLRTSLGDRSPASYVRGSSPAASRNGSKSGRQQSMSPTASRSVSSSHSRKGSVASSGDDDVESLLSIPVSSSDRSSPRNLNTSSNNRSFGVSKKPIRTVTSSSAPKRSLDMAMRQMDHQKGPYNMFRPLLSSVPSSTIYASKTGAMHRSTASRNSLITTSSNASSDAGFSAEHDNPKQEDHAREEVFTFDQTDSICEDDQIHVEIDDITELDTLLLGDVTMEVSIASEISGQKRDISMDGTLVCTKCGSEFCASEIIEGEPRLCKNCKDPENEIIDTDSPGFFEKDKDHHRSIDTTEELMVISECETLNLGKEVDQNSLNESESVVQTTRQQLIDPHMMITEGVGIPLLLRSSSGKGPVLRSRNFTATTIMTTFDDFSHMRDSSSFGHGTASSTSSSIDLGSSKQSETRFLRQLSGGRKSAENASSSIDLGSSKQSETRFHRQLSGGRKFAENASKERVLHGEAQEDDGLIISVDIESNGNWRSVSDLSTSSMSIIHVREEDSSILEDSDLKDNDQNPINSYVNGIEEQDVSSTHPEICPDSVEDVAEAKEDDDVSSPDSVFDVGSQNSKSSLEEDLHEPSHSVASVEEVEESIHQKHTQNTLEESNVIVDEGGNHKRSFTLEEATDAILFCRSIIHNLAYEAATLAVEKDNSFVLEPLQPVINDFNKRDNYQTLTTVTPRNSKSKSQQQKPRQKIVETDSKLPHVNDESSEVVSSTRIIGVANKGDTVKPLKLESKCNCAIM